MDTHTQAELDNLERRRLAINAMRELSELLDFENPRAPFSKVAKVCDHGIQVLSLEIRKMDRMI